MTICCVVDKVPFLNIIRLKKRISKLDNAGTRYWSNLKKFGLISVLNSHQEFGNFRIFLPPRFYVKSKLAVFVTPNSQNFDFT